MRLHDIYACKKDWWLPLRLLEEREAHQNISHKRVPSLGEHEGFITSMPYAAWYVIFDEMDRPSGCVYLTYEREIGVGVLKACRGRGLAKEAITELMRLHPGRFLANINPANQVSIRLFRKLGFGGPIQITLEHA